MDRLKTISSLCWDGRGKGDEDDKITNMKSLKEEARKHLKLIKTLEKNNVKRKILTNPLKKWIIYFFELDEDKKYDPYKNNYLGEVI